MPLLEHSKAIKGFYSEVKDQYPDMSFEQFELICKSPFQAIKHWIRSGSLPIILVKYLGRFKVSKSKIEKMMKIDNFKLANGKMEQAEFDYQNQFYKTYLKDLENEPNEIEIIDDTK